MAPAVPLPLRRLADLLTLARAVIGLPLLLAMGAGQEVLAWWLLLLGGLSDWADGLLARRAGGGSVWGARLDPLTDKILVSAPLLVLEAMKMKNELRSERDGVVASIPAKAGDQVRHGDVLLEFES